MKTNLAVLLGLFLLIATVSRCPASEPAATPSPAVTTIIPELTTGPSTEPYLQPGSPMTDGDLLFTSEPASPLGQIKGARALTGVMETKGPSVTFQVRSIADHRWTRYGSPTARISEGRLTIIIPTQWDTRPHQEDYQESLYESEPLTVKLHGTYKVFLAGREVGTLRVRG